MIIFLNENFNKITILLLIIAMLFSKRCSLVFISKNQVDLLFSPLSRWRKSRWDLLSVWFPPRMISPLLRVLRVAAQEDHWLLGRIASSSSRYGTSEFDWSVGRSVDALSMGWWLHDWSLDGVTFEQLQIHVINRVLMALLSASRATTTAAAEAT